MSYNWDDEATLLLIEKFKENELLWNPENPDYKSRIKRIETFRKIANLFGPNLDSTEIERKLKNLTSHYYRENKKYEEWKKSGAVQKKPKWFAYKSLEFLQNKIRLTQSKYENSAEQTKPVIRRKRSIQTEKDDDTAKKAKQRPASASSERDEAAIFGEYIVNKLRQMDPATTSTVEHLIQNIIYQAEMGVYCNNLLGSASALCQPSCETNSDHSDDANSEYGGSVKQENE